MFTVILEKNLLFYLMAVAGVIGVIGKLIFGATLRRLTKAAENMAKSEHRLMKLIRAKYEHASMVSDKVQNVDAFVDKYLFEYRSLGLRLHTWRQLEKQMIWLSGVAAAIGAAGSYGLTGVNGALRYYAAAGIAEMLLLYLLYQWGDVSHAWDVIHTYIVDYLENVCAHRMSKLYHAPSQEGVQEQKTEALGQPAFAAAGMDEPLREMRGGYYELPREEGMRFPEERNKTGAGRTLTELTQEPRKRDVAAARAGQNMQGPPDLQTAENLQTVQGVKKGFGEPERIRGQEERREPAVSREQRREAAREKVREAVLGTNDDKKMDESTLAIQLDEARKNMEKDSEERKVIIREILEQYLA